jgi:hypothetical protein
VAVSAITPQIDIPRPGERIGFAVLVTNTGKEPAKNLYVSLMVDGDKEAAESQAVDVLAPGKSTTVTLNAKMKEAGLHVITAQVKSDELPGDNRLDQVIHVRDFVQILLVDGAMDPSKGQDPKTAIESSSYFLGHALIPKKDEEKANYVVQVTPISPRQASGESLVDKDLCVMVNVALPSKQLEGTDVLPVAFLDALEKFVREGHGLMIFPGHKVNPTEYNAQLYEKHRLLPFPFKDGFVPIKDEREGKPKTALHFNKETAILPAYQPFREDKMYQLADAEIWQALTVDESVAKKKMPPAKTEPGEKDKAEDKNPQKEKAGAETASVALRYDDGNAAIITNKVDAGEVILFTAAPHTGWDPLQRDPTFKTLPLHPSFIPLMRVTLNHLLHQQSQEHNLIAGSPLNWFAPAKDAKKSFILLGPDGKKRQLGSPVPVKDRSIIKLENLPHAGVYALVAQEQGAKQADMLNDPVLIDDLRHGKVRVGLPFAVAPDLRESDNLEALTNEQIDSKLGFPVIHTIAGTDPAQFAGLDRTNREWTIWLLVLVLCVAVCESLLAWFCGRPI